MQLSKELRDRLESDLELLQKSAIHLLKSVSALYNISPEKMALELHVSPRIIVSWLTDSPPTLLECGAIFLFAEQQLFPIEWEIRGQVLGEYDDRERVPLIREFIEKVLVKLETLGFDGEENSREVNLLVDKGSLTLYQLGSFPGEFRIFLGVRHVGEELFIEVGRVDLLKDVSVGGDIQIHLPAEPKALTPNTIAYYIPGSDHTFTIEDWREMLRWLDNCQVIDKDFYLSCYLQNFRDSSEEPKAAVS